MELTLIKQKIEALGISKSKIAEKLGISLTYLSLMLKGDRTMSDLNCNKILEIIKKTEKTWASIKPK